MNMPSGMSATDAVSCFPWAFVPWFGDTSPKRFTSTKIARVMGRVEETDHFPGAHLKVRISRCFLVSAGPGVVSDTSRARSAISLYIQYLHACSKEAGNV